MSETNPRLFTDPYPSELGTMIEHMDRPPEHIIQIMKWESCPPWYSVSLGDGRQIYMPGGVAEREDLDAFPGLRRAMQGFLAKTREPILSDTRNPHGANRDKT